MTESLSQDELDALLADMGGDGSGGNEEESQSGGASGEIPASMEKAAGSVRDAFQSASGDVGVMLATSSSMDGMQMEMMGTDSIQASYGNQFIYFQTDLSGPATGTLVMAFPGEGVAKIIATATGAEEGDVVFDEDQMGAAIELLSPVLIAVARTLGPVAGGTFQTSPVTGIQSENAGSLAAVDHLVVSGELKVEGIMEGRGALFVPEALLSSGAQEAGAGIDMELSGGPSAPAASGSAPGRSGLLKQNLNLLMDVQMPLTVELGRTRKYVKEILGLGEGSIIELDKQAGEPVDLMVNKKLIAKGEVVVIDENFGVRVTDIVSPGERLKMG